MHGLIFETSVCYWQNQPGCYLCSHLAPRSQMKIMTEEFLRTLGIDFQNVTMRSQLLIFINNLDQLRSEEYFTCKYTILPSRAEYAFLISPKVKGVFMLQKRLFREKTYLKNIDHVIVISQIRQYNQFFPSTTSNQCEHDLHVR